MYLWHIVWILWRIFGWIFTITNVQFFLMINYVKINGIFFKFFDYKMIKIILIYLWLWDIMFEFMRIMKELNGSCIY